MSRDKPLQIGETPTFILVRGLLNGPAAVAEAPTPQTVLLSAMENVKLGALSLPSLPNGCHRTTGALQRPHKSSLLPGRKRREALLPC